MKTYRITISGCDDSTYIDVSLTDAEVETVRKIAELSVEASSYGCEPVMVIGEAS